MPPGKTRTSQTSRKASIFSLNRPSTPATKIPSSPGDPAPPASQETPVPVPHTPSAAKSLLASLQYIKSKTNTPTPAILLHLIAKFVSLPGVSPKVHALISAVLLLLPESMDTAVGLATRLSAIKETINNPAFAKACDPAKLDELAQRITQLGESHAMTKASADAAEAVAVETQKMLHTLSDLPALQTAIPEATPTQSLEEHRTERGKAPAKPQFNARSHSPDEATIKRITQDSCKILVEPATGASIAGANGNPLSARELVVKAELAVKWLWKELSKTDLTKEPKFATKPRLIFKSATMLPRGGVVYIMASPDQAALLCDARMARAFVQHYGDIVFRGQRAKTLVERVPVGFRVEDPESLRQLESDNGLQKGAISSASWIKQVKRRIPGQRKAHLKISLISQKDADDLIEHGVTIECTSTSARRIEIDPTRCLKCQLYRHKADRCKSTVEVCSQCTDPHRHEDCDARRTTKCASCNVEAHASWSRNCPAFLKARENINDRIPGNRRRFFDPTRQSSSRGTSPRTLLQRMSDRPAPTLGDELAAASRDPPRIARTLAVQLGPPELTKGKRMTQTKNGTTGALSPHRPVPLVDRPTPTLSSPLTLPAFPPCLSRPCD